MRIAAVGFGLATVLLAAAALQAEGRAPQGSKPVWRNNGYAAWKASQASGRPLLLFVTSGECPYCELMDRNTFSDGRVQARLRGSFEAARVEAAQNPALVQQLQIQAYPTTVVVDRSNRILDSITGYVEPREFERRLLHLLK